jgi:hypothetical protein
MPDETSRPEQILRTRGPILLAALEDAAEARIERTEGSCVDCGEAADRLCGTHQEDRERAGEYRRTFDELQAVLGRVELDMVCGDPVHGERPVGVDGEWSHTDGTPQCGDAEPAE